MWEIILKIWFFLAILPFTMATEGYNKLKKFLEKNNYKLDWVYVLLIVLVIFLIILLLMGFR